MIQIIRAMFLGTGIGMISAVVEPNFNGPVLWGILFIAALLLLAGFPIEPKRRRRKWRSMRRKK